MAHNATNKRVNNFTDDGFMAPKIAPPSFASRKKNLSPHASSLEHVQGFLAYFISLPIGVPDDHLPGIYLVTATGNEGLLLNFAAQLEKEI